MEQRVLEFYQKEFQRLWILPQKFETTQQFGQQIGQLQHASWMVDEMLEYIRDANPQNYDIAKVSRWIGFIQGVLWVYGVYTIDDMRDHIIEAKKKIPKILKSEVL